MFYVAKAILAVEAPEFQSIVTSLPPWDICRLVGTGNVRYIPGVESNALALVLSMIVNPDEDDDWVNEAVIAGNTAIDLFLDCIHAALKYSLPFIDRLYTAINSHKDIFLVCPFLRCFLTCAMRDDGMVRQYAWRTLPLKLSDMHPQLQTIWKEHMPHAYYEYTLFHKQFHGPAIKVIKALRSSVLPGRHNGYFHKLCRRPEHEVSIDEHPCKTIVEYKRDWRRARDVAAHHVTTHLFADWVNWELLVWTYAYIASIIFDSSDTQWCGRCFKALGRIFYDIVVKRHGMDLALVEEACVDRPLFHIREWLTRLPISSRV